MNTTTTAATTTATSWLDLMGDDSNISMASMASNISSNAHTNDPEFDNSKQGINLLLKTNVKFLVSDDSKSRKRTFDQIQINKSNTNETFLPPKAKQRTNVNGQWKKRKTEHNENNENKNETLNFKRFLNNNNPNNKSAVVLSNNINTNNIKTNNNKKKRITPILENVIFNRDLLLNNKVPLIHTNKNNNILSNNKIPIFLNADQFKEKEMEKEKEKREKEKREKEKEREESEREREIESSVWCNDIENEISNNEKTKEISWAAKLFPLEMSANKTEIETDELNRVNILRKERQHIKYIESILPPQTAPTVVQTAQTILSVSSDTINELNDESEDIDIINYKPSVDATEWRQKQIKIGKDTIGYKNYIKTHPNKDLRFRLNNNLMSTPDSKEKIGKKRWCGKYNKWRKFLHKFDNMS